MVRENYSKIPDEELVQRYRNSHDTLYIGELYQRYTHLVFGVCMKYFRNEMEAEDATMQIFEKLITDLKKHNVTVFKPWLHTVVRNHCMMKFRKDSTTGKRLTQLKYETKDIVENPEENHLDTAQEKEFVLQYLQEGIGSLKDEQRACIELFYLQDKSYAEVAEATGYSMNEVKSYIQNGKRNLKIFISSKNEQTKRG